LRLSGAALSLAIMAAAAASAGVYVQHTAAVDRQPPLLTISFPAAKGSYQSSAYAAACHPHGVCGKAHDSSGVHTVQVSVRSEASGKYWYHWGFHSATKVYAHSVVNLIGGKSVNWHQWLPAKLAQGRYTVSVIATDRLGNKTRATAAKTVSFTIDNTAPPAPSLGSLPQDHGTQTSASVAFSDRGAGVSFRCALDGAVAHACQSPQTYNGLALGSHRFCVSARDAAGNQSSASCYRWQIDSLPSGPAPLIDFSISGAATSVLTPGGPESPVDVSFHNPNSVSITATGVIVAIDSVAGGAGSCPLSGNFTIARQLTQDVVIPANATKSLSQLGLPQSQWPALRMLDNGDQDGCRGASLALSYSGSAH
jgi:hypothetical protein